MTGFNLSVVDGVVHPARVAHGTGGTDRDRAAGSGADAAENQGVTDIDSVGSSEDTHDAGIRFRFGDDEMSVGAVIWISRIKTSDEITAAVEVDVPLREQTIRERTLRQGVHAHEAGDHAVAERCGNKATRVNHGA